MTQVTTIAPVNISRQVTAIAPVNIAVIKYWGKRDDVLNLPSNASLSVTLSTDDLRARTTATFGQDTDQDTIVLNGASEQVSKRTQACFESLRALRRTIESKCNNEKLADKPLLIRTENNFPTAAGLASSAAGFAALVYAVAGLFELNCSAEELSAIARQGSGSACRSLMGGFVAWNMGTDVEPHTSCAEQIAEKRHWPEIRALICVVSGKKKDVPSTAGMQLTVKESSLFPTRAEHIVKERMHEMHDAIKQRNFAKFAEVTMRDSNQFHAVCLDTWPPIFYLNDTSRAIIRLVERLNSVKGTTIAAYTFDAGPNAVIYFEEQNERQIVDTLREFIGTEVDGWPKNIKGTESNSTLMKAADNDDIRTVIKGNISRVILTRVGDGPRYVDEHVKLEVPSKRMTLYSLFQKSKSMCNT